MLILFYLMMICFHEFDYSLLSLFGPLQIFSKWGLGTSVWARFKTHGPISIRLYNI